MNPDYIEQSFYEIDSNLTTLFNLLKIDYAIDEQSNLIIFQSETNYFAISGQALDLEALKNIIMSSETIRIRLSFLQEIIDRLEINSFLIDNEVHHDSLINEAIDNLLDDVIYERNGLYDRVSDLESDIEKAENKINNLESENDDLQAKLETSDNEFKELENLKDEEIRNLENQLNAALTRIEELESISE